MNIRCKDYHIVKISFKYLNKYDNVTLYKKRSILSDEYTKFKLSFIERFSGHTFEYWAQNYIMDSFQCGFEYICEKYKMFIRDVEGAYVYMIPKNNIEMIEWFNQNLLLPHKIVKKINLGIYNYISEKELWPSINRKYAREFTVKQISEKPEIYKNFKEYDTNLKF